MTSRRARGTPHAELQVTRYELQATSDTRQAARHELQARAQHLHVLRQRPARVLRTRVENHLSCAARQPHGRRTPTEVHGRPILFAATVGR